MVQEFMLEKFIKTYKRYHDRKKYKLVLLN